MVNEKNSDDFVDRMIYQSNFITAALDIIHSAHSDEQNQDELNVFYTDIAVKKETLFNEISNFLNDSF